MLDMWVSAWTTQGCRFEFSSKVPRPVEGRRGRAVWDGRIVGFAESHAERDHHNPLSAVGDVGDQEALGASGGLATSDLDPELDQALVGALGAGLHARRVKPALQT